MAALCGSLVLTRIGHAMIRLRMHIVADDKRLRRGTHPTDSDTSIWLPKARHELLMPAYELLRCHRARGTMSAVGRFDLAQRCCGVFAEGMDERNRGRAIAGPRPIESHAAKAQSGDEAAARREMLMM